MKFYHQGFNECFPTSLGIYLEKNPKEIIEEILGEPAKETAWSECTSPNIDPEKWQQVMINMGKFIKKNIPWLPAQAYMIDSFYFSARYMNGIPFWPNKLPSEKGFITLFFFSKSMLFGLLPPRHIIAFDGLTQTIYDPGTDGPMSYRDYRSLASPKTFPDGIYCEKGVLYV